MRMTEVGASTRPTCTFHYEEEHLHEGIVFCEALPASRAEEIRNLDLTRNDVIVATYPRSGTTWVCEMVSMVTDFDSLGTKPRNTHRRIPFVDIVFEGDPRSPEIIETVKRRNSPKSIRTHQPVQFIQRQVTQNHTKLIVVVRNPRDMLVSYFRYHLTNPVLAITPEPTWDEFFDLVKVKKLVYGDWLEHLKGYWRLKHLPNVLFVFYEQLKMRTAENVKRLATFLGKELDDEAIREIAKAVQIEKFRTSPHIKVVEQAMKKGKFKYVNEGVIGTWKQYFNRDQDTWVAEHYDVELNKLGIPVHVETARL